MEGGYIHKNLCKTVSRGFFFLGMIFPPYLNALCLLNVEGINLETEFPILVPVEDSNNDCLS
jgi:hypothetical protein